jgi:hypothetical protein
MGRSLAKIQWTAPAPLACHSSKYSCQGPTIRRKPGAQREAVRYSVSRLQSRFSGRHQRRDLVIMRRQLKQRYVAPFCRSSCHRSANATSISLTVKLTPCPSTDLRAVLISVEQRSVWSVPVLVQEFKVHFGARKNRAMFVQMLAIHRS